MSGMLVAAEVQRSPEKTGRSLLVLDRALWSKIQRQINVSALSCKRLQCTCRFCCRKIHWETNCSLLFLFSSVVITSLICLSVISLFVSKEKSGARVNVSTNNIYLRETWQTKGCSGSLLAVRTGNMCPSSHLYAARTALLKPLNLSPVSINLRPMCWWACASGRSAVPLPLSSLPSGPAAPHWCCWVLGRPSPASPWVSCCSGGRTPTTPATPRIAGRAPPGTQTSPCRWGWAGRGT